MRSESGVDGDHVELRPATMEDARLLYEWRTDPVTIAMFDHPPPASFDAHVAWLRARLADAALFVIVAAGEPVGTIRVDPDHDISVTIAPAARGRGYATAAIRALLSRGQLVRAIARIKPGNAASQHAFTQAGFRRSPPDDDASHWAYVWTR